MNKKRPARSLHFLLIAGTILLLLFCLPMGAEAAKKKKPLKDPWIMTHYADLSGKQGMFYTLYHPTDKKLIVIDGGWAANQGLVRRTIKKCGGVVHAWILTHYHDDHVEAFNEIYSDPKGIRIRNVYVSPMDYNTYLMVAKEWDDPEDFGRFLSITENAPNIHRVARGDRFSMSGLKFHFLNSYDSTLLKEIGNNDLPNNGGLVFKVSGNRDSMLFCGDAHSAMLGDYLIRRCKKELPSTYVQVGHHGNNSFPTYFYEAV
ncbi:MAG: competence protein, partial [Lachnospiraceae bacterium]|nr:competence protein [Lachnospiraceae bacterium]